ncbi:MAG: T9SS type A sorting domain-containing protein [Bacteroidales bacterium]|nr:T9SS type A sorting domain-containing protein [Bacteroidales bacterium]
MKKLLVLLLLIISVSVYSQRLDYSGYDINFEDTTQFVRIQIDTISNPNNVWQIGKPQKEIFTSAYSAPNAIVTDTINPYPINDTSSFIIKHIVPEMTGFCPYVAKVAGRYKIDSDTLTDFGIIEFSPDNGNVWINLLTDTQYVEQIWSYNEIPVLTGSLPGWNYFSASVAHFGPIYNIQPGDTVLYRFTFVSDSIQTNKDGLIFDNLYFQDWVEGINKIKNQFNSEIYPNPSSGITDIKFRNDKNEAFELTLFDSNGIFLFAAETNNSNKIRIDLSNYKSGIYFYKLLNKNNNMLSSGKILKQ